MAKARRNAVFSLLFLSLFVVSTFAFTSPNPKLKRAQGTQLSLSKKKLIENVLKRFDTLEASGLKKEYPNHPPLAAGMKTYAFWITVAFAYKWYRARFINKIDFWDRQPMWNMVVTTKEQDDQLRAYTCKNCGSTLFIARNREWYFEGDTGLAGLGCYTCGAKGKENFVMNRKEIVEEMGEDDDYFDFEKPLDFVTAAERKALLKATGGNEEEANQILIEAQKAESGETEKTDDADQPPMFGITEEEAEEKRKEAESETEETSEEEDSPEVDSSSENDILGI